MLKHVTLAMDTTDPATWERAEVEDLSAYLATRFKRFPSNARIYHQHVAETHDVTPADGPGVALLATLPGPFYVAVFPGDPATVTWLALTIFSLAVSAVLAPSPPAPPNVAQRNQGVPSSNNELSSRTNRPRINGRIPDIFGTVRSTPDLIALPYKVFENNREVEYSYMCVGRGKHDIADVRDGDTLCVNIPGTMVRVYAPNTSPNSGDAPQLTIGTPISVPVLSTRRSNSVSGQVLRPPNTKTFTANANVRFVYPNLVELAPGSIEEFTQYFVDGDEVTIADAVITAGDPVTEKLSCLATSVQLRISYQIAKAVFGTYNYDTAGGALLFGLGDQTAVYGLFTPGQTITLTQTKASSRHPSLDLSGDFLIASVSINAVTAQEASRGVQQYVIVKLSSPGSVNADWNNVKSGSDSWDKFNEAGDLAFDISHAGADVSYSLNLNGTYNVVNVESGLIVLDNPAGVNSEWGALDDVGGNTPFISPTIQSTEQGRWVGPFILTDVTLQQLFLNFVAQSGLYKEDASAQTELSIAIEVQAWPVNTSDAQIGDAESFTITLSGSDTLKETVAATLTARISSFVGRCAVRARRVTAHDEDFEGQVVDEVRWRDLYSVAFVVKKDFGNVTTVQAITYATASALAVKERKLNMLATRCLPVYDADTGTFDDVNLAATENAADILVAICRDRYIGNRRLAELDVPNIYATVAAVQEYFGHADPSKFCYTFDQDTVSFEEAVGLVAQAVYSIAYRRGNVIRLSFERRADTSTLLFNHRNKVPGTERRTVSFGYSNDNDGIEYVYVNPDDDSIISVFLPEGYAAINPKRIESIGVRNHLQAYFQAWRAWNKLQYQYLAVEFEATSESELLLKNDRILVADNTRPGTQDGEVVAVDTLELTLSQPVDLTEFDSYVIRLQHVDGSVESIGISAGSEPNKVVLDDAPAMPLATDPEGHVRAGYVIAGGDADATAFLVSERETLSKMTSRVQAVNYDERYYANDPDLDNDVIGEGGYGPDGGFTPAHGCASRCIVTIWPAVQDEVGDDFTTTYTGFDVRSSLGVLRSNTSSYQVAVLRVVTTHDTDELSRAIELGIWSDAALEQDEFDGVVAPGMAEDLLTADATFASEFDSDQGQYLNLWSWSSPSVSIPSDSPFSLSIESGTCCTLSAPGGVTPPPEGTVTLTNHTLTHIAQHSGSGSFPSGVSITINRSTGRIVMSAGPFNSEGVFTGFVVNCDGITAGLGNNGNFDTVETSYAYQGTRTLPYEWYSGTPVDPGDDVKWEIKVKKLSGPAPDASGYTDDTWVDFSGNVSLSYGSAYAESKSGLFEISIRDKDTAEVLATAELVLQATQNA